MSLCAKRAFWAIRLALREASAPYTTTTSLTFKESRDAVTGYLQRRLGNPPYYAPPLLKHGNPVVSQTNNTPVYLSRKLRLGGSTEDDAYRVGALNQTALDGLLNEVRDCHHPISLELYWEDQKKESVGRSKE